MAETGAFGIVGALGAVSKEVHSGIGVMRSEVGWGDGNSFSLPEGIREEIRDGEGLWFIGVSVGHGWGSGRSGVGCWGSWD